MYGIQYSTIVSMEINKEEPPQEANTNIEADYTNEQILTSTLPKIEQIQFEQIQKTSLYVEMIVLAIMTIIVLIGALLLILFSEKARAFYPYIFTLIALVMAFIYVSEIKGFKHVGYAVRTHDIIYKHGWLWRSIVAVPFNRIQHIEVHQGPIDRLFDLSSIILYTAGGSDVEIEGLLPDKANSIKAYVMSKNQELKNTPIDDESE